MRTICLLLISTHLSFVSSAELPTDAAKVIGDYQRTRAEGITRLNTGLIEKLVSIQKQHMAANRLPESNAIQEQIDTLKAEIVFLGTNGKKVAISEATRSVGAQPAKAFIAQAGDAKLTGGLKFIENDPTRIDHWEVGGTATWGRVKVNPGTYKITYLGGGFRPWEMHMKITVGAATTNFEVWPNTGGNPTKDFDVGVITIASPAESLEITLTEKRQGKVATDPGSSSHLRSITLTPQ